MSKRIFWVLASLGMALSLVVAACAPAAPTAPATPTTPPASIAPASPATSPAPTPPVQIPTQTEAVKPKEDTPKYGGELSFALANPMDSWVDGLGWGVTWNLLYDHLWDADWTKGSAGGYGARETDWSINHDRFDLYTGAVAQDYKWAIDPQTDKVKITLTIRQGVYFYEIPGSQASAIVRGRQLTADDVVKDLDLDAIKRQVPLRFPNMKEAKVTKTGPWEVTIEFVGSSLLRQALAVFMGRVIRAPELVQKVEDWTDWKLHVATGPYMMVDYVPSSSAIFLRNPKWWNKDPIGPGKGYQLPYVEKIKYLILPDASTRQAALRTAKIDMMQDYILDDANTMRRTATQLQEHQYYAWGAINPSLQMRTDMPPFNDVRVRRAMMMATDFNAIRNSLFGGKGVINTFPFTTSTLYAPLYIAHDDPELPQQVKELYSYNPDKAKQLLKEAGYPNGLKVDILVRTTNVDYVSIFKDMWGKVGVELNFMSREAIIRDQMVREGKHPPMAVGWSASLSSFTRPVELAELGNVRSVPMLKVGSDPVLDKAWDELGRLANTDYLGAMKRMRQILIDYILPQAYGIPAPDAPSTVFWWPWLKNYSGEVITLSGKYNRWAAWVWVDTGLKKSMGY